MIFIPFPYVSTEVGFADQILCISCHTEFVVQLNMTSIKREPMEPGLGFFLQVPNYPAT
jgi:hypothetical protein